MEQPGSGIDRRTLLKLGAVGAGAVTASTAMAAFDSTEAAALGINLTGTGPSLYSGNGPIAASPPIDEAFWELEAERLLLLFNSMDELFPAPSVEEEEVSFSEVENVPTNASELFLDGSTEISRSIASSSSALLAPDTTRGLDIDLILPGDIDGSELFVPQREVRTAGLFTGATEEVAWQIRKRIGSYQIRLSLKKGYLPSCIRRTGWYVGVDVQRITNGRGTRLFNLHLTGWWTWRGPCFGVWESIRTGYCKTSCTWNLWKFVAAAAAGILAYQLSGWVLGAVSNAIAGGVVGGLTLAPGVPPPP